MDRKLTEAEAARVLASVDASAAVLAFLVDLAIACERCEAQAAVRELLDAAGPVVRAVAKEAK
jgi:hypothetical protein